MRPEVEEAMKALHAAVDLFPKALGSREWFRLDSGFGVDVYADYRDAEFHFRALYRLLACNEPAPGQTTWP